MEKMRDTTAATCVCPHGFYTHPVTLHGRHGRHKYRLLVGVVSFSGQVMVLLVTYIFYSNLTRSQTFMAQQNYGCSTCKCSVGDSSVTAMEAQWGHEHHGGTERYDPDSK